MYKKNKMSKFVVIMPMAGRGLRFKKYNYSLPKPLIKINQQPMFVQSSKAFSNKFKWFFIIQKSLKKYKIFKKSINLFKNKKIITLNKYTKGQASTVEKAVKFLKKDQIVIVHSCDLSFKINFKEIRKKLKKYDVLVLTAKGKKYNFNNPRQFSWVRKNYENGETEISFKKNFTKNKNKSRVLVGSFIFKNCVVLNKSIKYTLKNKVKIKNEYYLDQAASTAKRIGFQLGEIIVKKYHSWGSHTELTNNKLC